METVTALRSRVDAHCWWHPFRSLPIIADTSLILGRGTVLMPLAMTRSGEVSLAVEADQERLLALLSATYGWQPDPNVLRHVNRASARWQRGEKAEAHIDLSAADTAALSFLADATPAIVHALAAFTSRLSVPTAVSARFSSRRP